MCHQKYEKWPEHYDHITVKFLFIRQWYTLPWKVGKHHFKIQIWSKYKIVSYSETRQTTMIEGEIAFN